MFNVTTLNHFHLVVWLFPAAFYFNNCIAHIFYTQDPNYYTLFPLNYKLLRHWEVCSLHDPKSFAASHSLMYFINWCTWKSSQYYIIVIVMASFMRVSCKLVFHQSKCITSIKPILSSTNTYISLSSFMYLCIFY